MELDEFATHGLSCILSEVTISDICYEQHIKSSLALGQVPSMLEPSGLIRMDGKWPDGVSIAAWILGLTFTWEVICPDTFAVCYIPYATKETKKQL